MVSGRVLEFTERRSMFPEMFGYENTLFGPKGKAHEAFGKCKRKFCGDQRLDARNPGVWG